MIHPGYDPSKFLFHFGFSFQPKPQTQFMQIIEQNVVS